MTTKIKKPVNKELTIKKIRQIKDQLGKELYLKSSQEILTFLKSSSKLAKV